jgi:hypothetical protein
MAQFQELQAMAWASEEAAQRGSVAQPDHEAAHTKAAAAAAAAAVSAFLAWIGSPCLRPCVHGASIGGGGDARSPARAAGGRASHHGGAARGVGGGLTTISRPNSFDRQLRRSSSEDIGGRAVAGRLSRGRGSATRRRRPTRRSGRWRRQRAKPPPRLPPPPPPRSCSCRQR